MDLALLDAARRHQRNQWFVTVLCLSGALGAGYLLFSDLTATDSSGKGESLASLEWVESKVRRRSAASFVWGLVEAGGELRRKDSVQTGQGARASIRFKNGNRLDLNENSLVVVDAVEDLSLQFGSATVRGTDGRDSRVSVGSDGKRNVEVLPVKVLAPADGSRSFVLVTHDKDPLPEALVPFRVAVASPMPATLVPQLQVSVAGNFQSGKTRELPLAKNGTDYENSVRLPVGLHRWRVVDASTGRVLSAVQNLEVLPASVVRPAFPGREDRISRWGEAPQLPVGFRWAAPRSGSLESRGIQFGQHALEVSAEEAFKGVLFKRPIMISEGGVTLDVPLVEPSKKLFWRITSEYLIEGQRRVLFSPAREFQVSPGRTIEVQGLAPEPGAEIEGGGPIRFAWTPSEVVPGVEYRLELQSGGSVGRSRTESSLWREPSLGKNRWRVTALFSGNPIGHSSWQDFQVVAEQPLRLLQPEAGREWIYFGRAPIVKFRWEESRLIRDQSDRAYALELTPASESAEATLIRLSRRTEATSDVKEIAAFLARLAGSGKGLQTLRWRVAVLDANGKILKRSEERVLRYGVPATLRAPASEQMQPRAGHLVSLVQEEKVPEFSWSEVEGAEAYELQIVKAGSGGKAVGAPVFSKVVTRSRVEVGELPEGDYLWSVRSLDPNRRPGEFAEWRGLRVAPGATLSAPEITSSEVQ